MGCGRTHWKSRSGLFGGRSRSCLVPQPASSRVFVAFVVTRCTSLEDLQTDPLSSIAMSWIEQPSHCFLDGRHVFTGVTGVFVLLRRSQYVSAQFAQLSQLKFANAIRKFRGVR